LPLSVPDFATFHTPDETGYTDYPAMPYRETTIVPREKVVLAGDTGVTVITDLGIVIHRPTTKSENK
jgi:hypothetical protein